MPKTEASGDSAWSLGNALEFQKGKEGTVSAAGAAGNSSREAGTAVGSCPGRPAAGLGWSQAGMGWCRSRRSLQEPARGPHLAVLRDLTEHLSPGTDSFGENQVLCTRGGCSGSANLLRTAQTEAHRVSPADRCLVGVGPSLPLCSALSRVLPSTEGEQDPWDTNWVRARPTRRGRGDGEREAQPVLPVAGGMACLTSPRVLPPQTTARSSLTQAP